MSKGPLVRILGLSAGDGRPMPEDGAIQIAFDRYLLPSTVSRQAVLLLDSANEQLPNELRPNVIYDPVARTVTLTRPQSGPWLTSGQIYKVVLPIPSGEDDLTGLRAIDRATLDPNQTLAFAFLVAPAMADGGVAPSAPGIVPGEPENVSFCKDVLPIFFLKCSAPSCHGSGDTAAASLVLDTSIGITHTAINRVAQGSNTGAIAGVPRASGRVFGVDLPIIAVNAGTAVPSGNPAESWLMYKLELAPSPPADAPARPKVVCQGGQAAPAQATGYAALAPAALEPNDTERALLSDRVLGRQMPYPPLQPGSYGEQALTFQERETIRMWIARGAHVDDCGACTTN